VRRFVAAVRGRWKAHDSGMLGLSVDKEARLACTGSFAGEAALWRLTERRREALARLSVKALKEALAQHRLPSEGLFEKRELVERLVLHLPVAERLCDLAHHRPGETVVSTAVWRDVVVTGSRDCTARVSRIFAADESSAAAAEAFSRSGRSFSGGGSARSGSGSGSSGGPSAFSSSEGPASVPWGAAADCFRIPIAPASFHEPVKYEREWRYPAGKLVPEQIAELVADAPIDVVNLDPRFGRVMTGDKGGDVRVFDLASGGACTHTFRQGDCWVWCVKSAGTWDSTMGHEPGAPRFGLGEHLGNEAAASAGGSRAAARGEDGEGEEALEEEELEQVADGVYVPVRPSDPVRMLRPAAGSAAAEAPYLGDGNMIFTGNTLGEVRLYDLRTSSAVQRVRIAPDHLRAAFHGGGAPITGVQPDFVHHRFATSSFDGALRVFDLRTFKPAVVISCFAMGDDSGRLARVDITPTMAAAGGMDGALYVADFLGDDARHEAMTAQ
jgi:WD40 repeat protein